MPQSTAYLAGWTDWIFLSGKRLDEPMPDSIFEVVVLMVLLSDPLGIKDPDSRFKRF